MFSSVEYQAYLDFTQNGLTHQDPSPYPNGSHPDRLWRIRMLQHERGDQETLEPGTTVTFSQKGNSYPYRPAPTTAGQSRNP